jgi:hypothetical protein
VSPTVRDFLGFIVNPPPGDGSRTAASDLLPKGAVLAGSALGGQVPVADGLGGYAWATTTGTALPCTVVDSLSANPRLVSDWGPILNTAIAGGTRCFSYGPYDYPFSTAITAIDKSDMHWYGSGGTSMTWTGTGSGYAIDMSSSGVGTSGGQHITDIFFKYSSNTFTGILLNLTNGFYVKLEGCSFGSTNYSTVKSAKAAVSLNNMNTILLERCNFAQTFTSAVRGEESGSGFCNVVHFTECTFYARAITNLGADWVLDHCVFEGPALAAGDSFITTDLAAGDNAIDLTLRNCDYWDLAGGTQKIVYFPVHAPLSDMVAFTALNCNDHAAAGQLAKLYDLQCRGSVQIVGGSTSSIVDFGDATIGGANSVKKYQILMSGFGAATCTGLFTGHDEVNVIGPNWGGTIGQSNLGTITAEREYTTNVSSAQQPTLAVHAGATGISIWGNPPGTDLAGIVTVRNTTGAPSSIGPIADITFKQPPAARTSAANFPAIQITPISPISGAGSGEFGDYGAAAVATGPYAWWNQTNGLTKFSIAITTALPAATTACYAYRVTML